MNFFEQQDRARRRTGLLVVLFVAAVAAIISAVYVAALLALGGDLVWEPDVFLAVTLVTVLIVAAGSTYRIITLSGGGAAVAAMLGGRKVTGAGADRGEQMLVNVVEEMSIAAGLPRPGIYVLNDEAGINAFAAGTRPDNAVVAVTRGCLNALTRDELQGVVAHEFSHILNSDMTLNIRLMGVLHGILVIGLIGELLVRSMRHSRPSGRRKGDAGAAIILFGLLLWLIGYIGVFFGNLIKAAVSRQREFLADASAVQFTRNPGGIAGALEKIARATALLAAPQAAEASHLFFGQGVKAAFFGLMATHPPLPERISRIRGVPLAELPPTAAGAAVAGAAAGAAGFAGGGAAAAVTASAGRLDEEHIAYAAALLQRLPDELRQTVREPFGALAVVFGLLLDRDATVREQQLAWLTEQHAPLAAEARALLPRLTAAGPQLRLPLAELAVATLRDLSAEQYAAFKPLAERLALWDGGVTVFEYALLRVVRQRLDAHFAPAGRPGVKYLSLAPVAQDVVVVLSALARAGSADAEQAGQAFAAGMQVLRVANVRGVLLAPSACGVTQVDAALDRLLLIAPGARQTLLAALAATAVADDRICPEELELLRAVAAALAIPVPPLPVAA